jgi:outer membrane protein OmpA-like peptidoglycan-associated protein
MQDELSAGRVAKASSHTHRRMYVRADAPVWPFAWRGLLPLLGLLGLVAFSATQFARNDIEQVVRAETRAHLASQGFNWAHVEVSGQHVTLTGTAPTSAAADAALESARAATCPTWLGRKVCAVAVTGSFAQPAATAAPVPAPRAASAPSTASAAARACEQSLAETVARSGIKFTTGSAAIQSGSVAVLDALAAIARECPGKLSIEGHTDDIGDADRNLALSRARAESVRAALAERGVPGQRMSAQGYGETKPTTSNADAQGRAANRRIEFKVAAGL